MKYRKRPVVIEAFQLSSHEPRPAWFIQALEKETVTIKPDFIGETAIIHTLEGDMIADHDDYIIQGISGELYPCKPDIFVKTYELVKE
jgi:hypothetical protein